MNVIPKWRADKSIVKMPSIADDIFGGDINDALNRGYDSPYADAYTLLVNHPLSAEHNRPFLAQIEPYINTFPLRHLLCCARVPFDGRLFTLDRDGVPALIVPHINEFNEGDNFVAFDLANLTRFGRLNLRGWCLGVRNVFMSNAFGSALQIHLNLLSWLGSGGKGIFILDFGQAITELHQRMIVAAPLEDGGALEARINAAKLAGGPVVCDEIDDDAEGGE